MTFADVWIASLLGVMIAITDRGAYALAGL